MQRVSLYCPECHTNYGDGSIRVCPVDGTRLYRVDDDDPLIGQVMDGRFRIDYTLGVGGMGTVYGGVQLSVNRDVAVKVLRTELSTREVALERFFREAKTISKLSHPNIVKLIDFGQDRDRGLLYLVMELVRGQSLGDLLSRGRLRAALALDIVYQVCGALTEPHAEGVIHRDLKPDNLLIVPVSDGTIQAKVLDFGIARFMESNTQLTGTGMICGTPAYMAPEQAQNESLDSRTDLYALGVILYEMLSGWPPFSGTSSLQVMLKHIQEAPVQLRELLPPATLPEPLEELTYHLMAKERPLRPKSARVVRDAIDQLRIDLDIAPVRLDSDRPADEQLDSFVLPKLPRPDEQKSGPTQVLRRETGMVPAVVSRAAPDPADPEEERPTSQWSPNTQADEALGVTGPLTPDGRLEVLADAQRMKVETRGGGQQAWTPGDQAAVQSIKNTQEDRIDAWAATAAATPSTETPVQERRQTLVEANSEAIVGEPAPTEDSISPAIADRLDPDLTATNERNGPTSDTNLPLAAVAVIAGLLAIGAAVYVVRQIDEVVSRAQNPVTPTVTAIEPPQNSAASDSPPASTKTSDPSRIANFLNAQFAAQTKIHSGMTEGLIEARATARRKARNAPEKKTGTVEDKPADSAANDPNQETVDPNSGKKSPDAIIESLGLRDDDG